MARKHKEWTTQDELNEFHLLLSTIELSDLVVLVQLFEVKGRLKLDMAKCFWPYLGSNEFEEALPLHEYEKNFWSCKSGG